MSIAEIVLLGVALAMDAFAVTLSNAFCHKGASRARLCALPLAFGAFQGLMPLLGFFLGGVVGSLIEAYAGIVTLVILGLIGGNMIKEGVSALRHPEEQACAASPERLTAAVILMQAVATSIDAFAVGVSLRAVNVDIAVSAGIIALTTCACCFAALALGRRFGHVLGDRAQIVGGAVLVLIGLKAMLP